MSPYRRILVIMNPAAGFRKSARTLGRIEEHLRDNGIEYVARKTKQQGDALRWARTAHAEGFDLVMAAGGDGTVREAVEGVMRSGSRIPLAQVPIGTTNVSARSLSIPTDAKKAIQLVTTGAAIPFDVGYLPDHDRHFVFVAGAGYDAKIIRDTPRELKQSLGFLAYVGTGFRHARDLKPVRVDLEIDHEIHTLRAHTVMIINMAQLAQLNWAAAPNMNPHDGKFNIMVLSSRSLWGSLVVFIKFLTKRYRGYEDIRYFTGERIRVTADPPLPVQIDGEHLGSTPFLCEVIPDGIRLVVPKRYAEESLEPQGSSGHA